MGSAESLQHLLDQPAAEFAAPFVRAIASGMTPSVDTLIGPWRIIREAGRGGMGAVYLAERADDQYRQRAALKVVRSALALDDHLVRRFRDERQILAALEHPNIARLLDGGVTPDGVPWFAMEFVEGMPIDRHVRERALPVDVVLNLFLSVCDAVQYAHQNLIVHRDLKPSNMLVTAAGQVKLLDFGVARLVQAGEHSAPATTLTAAHLMTPAYASPEQIRGEPIAVASDVYSLGVVLYELFAGRTPHGGDGQQPHVLAQRVVEEDPVPPSTRLSGAAAWHVRGDLDNIVAMALRKEPARRYPSVEAFADDIRRHLDGRPVVARGNSSGYRARTFIKRHRVATLSIALVGLSLVLGLGLSLSQARRADRERDAARIETVRAEQVAGFLAKVFYLADPNVALGQTITIGAALDSAAAWLDRDLDDSPAARADIALVLGEIFGAMGRSDRHHALAAKALATQEGLYSADDPRLARALTSLAEAMRGQGQLAQSEPFLRRALAIQRGNPAAPAYDLDHTLNMLALALRNQGRAADGRRVLEEALVISRRNALSHPIGLHRTLTNLGHLDLANGNPASAEALYREVLELRRAHWGVEHPEVANALINLATAVGRQRRFDEAESLFHEGLAMRRRLQGNDHAEVGIDLGGLGEMYHARGDLVRAEATYRDALSLLRLTLGDEHPRSIAAEESLKVVRREAGRRE